MSLVLFVLQKFAAVWAQRETLVNRAGQKGLGTSQGRELGHTGAASECTASKGTGGRRRTSDISPL